MPAAGPLVLVVDDDDAIRDMVAFILYGEGYAVAQAADGAAAAAMVKDGLRPRIILLDLIMPKMNGAQFAEWLAEYLLLRERPRIIVMSADVNTRIPSADAHLSKPYDIDDVLAHIKRLLSTPRTLPQTTHPIVMAT